MTKIIMLGTAAASAGKSYNTCFVIENENNYFLVDTGCSNRVLDNLKYANIELNKIHNVFISHKHMDHLLGLFWILRQITILIKKKEYNGKLNIYCNEEVSNIIMTLYKMLLRKSQADIIDNFINVITVKDNETKVIDGIKYTFFDTKTNEVNLYGFEAIIKNKKLVFLGDEKCNPINYGRLYNVDCVMHEAFCLEKDKKQSGVGASTHSSVEDVVNNLKGKKIKKLILYHSKNNDKIDKKFEFEKVGNELFDGKVIVPNDLEIIEL